MNLDEAKEIVSHFDNEDWYEELGATIDGVEYGLDIVDEGDWNDQGKYQYKDITGVLCKTSEDGSVTKYDIAVTQYITRSGSYFSDYYYDYDPLQVDQLVQKVIPQQIIPERNDELINHIVCKKKCDNYIESSVSGYTIESEIIKIIPVHKKMYSYDVTTSSAHFEVSGIYSHNCRSFLTVDRFSDKVGNISNAKNFDKTKHKYYGRFNQGVVTISLPDIALSSDGDINKFWEIFDERTELCHKALKSRHNRLLGTSSDVAPILWQYGALARLKKHEKISRLLYDGYSTISLGYAGLYECVKFMTGHSHSDEGVGEEFGLKVMQALNDKCNQWKEEENIDYSLYGTPLESTTYKFAKSLKNRFGKDVFVKIDGKDRNYITNSYHIPVFEPITAFEKLRIESKFQKLSPGGAISYIEIPSMTHNIPAILEVIKFIYNNIMYAEINTKNCYCEKCGFDGDIPLVEDEDGILKWKCPNCGNTDNTTMDIAFRVCGYIGTAKNGGNQGRYGDIHDRVYHLDDTEYEE